MNKFQVADRLGIKVDLVKSFDRGFITLGRILDTMDNYDSTRKKRDFWFNSKSTSHIGETNKRKLWEAYIMPVRNEALSNVIYCQASLQRSKAMQQFRFGEM